MRPAVARNEGEGVSPLFPQRSAPHHAAPIDVPNDFSAVAQGRCATFTGHPCNVRAARRWVRFAPGLHTTEKDTLELVISELFTNSIRHSKSGDNGQITVAIIRESGRVQLKVIDEGPRAKAASTPHLRPLDPASDCGRGLFLVHAYAHRWGVIADRQHMTVWVELLRQQGQG
ncbi:ATP-binding protein [Allosalinactinospora lopnorensis]|uniref:ATP-binding protein n=1 Tax=Allosalinactinospora lopnorensis TaxID=1352348 RepID=UPI0006990337|nr:ATP-binding protein [Allosalinactinospora lopnorensis]